MSIKITEIKGSLSSRSNHMKHIKSILPQYHCMECNKEMTEQETLNQIYTSLFDFCPDKYDQFTYGYCSSCSDEVCDRVWNKIYKKE